MTSQIRPPKSIGKSAETATLARIRQRVEVPENHLSAYCQRNHIKSLALFGSVLRDDFRPDSDIDVLVEFQTGYTPGFLKLASMESELSSVFGNRKVDLRTPQDLSRYFRERVLREAVVICR